MNKPAQPTHESKFNLRKETVKTLHVKTGVKTARGCIHRSGSHTHSEEP